MSNNRSKQFHRFQSTCSIHLASAGGVRCHITAMALEAEKKLLKSLLSQGGIMSAPKHAIYIRASCDLAQMSHPRLTSSTHTIQFSHY